MSSQQPSFDSDRDRVRDRADIVRIVGEHIKLIPKGREYVGLCPFHDDHKPSMSVVPNKQIFHCFSCGSGGDVFTFVQKYHRMDFREALEFLAERVGIELTRRVSEAQAEPGTPSRRDVIAANAFAQAFFARCLEHPAAGSLAREAITSRGIAPEMVEAFGLGAAPDNWEGLVTAATKKGLAIEALIAAGLAKARNSSSGHFDMFRNRLVFPIRDQAGRPIAFGARKLDAEDEPKYLNSPESSLFNKSATLYGLDVASRTIQKTGRAVVTEGYTDTIACHQAGFTSAVATLGTAFTTEHAKLLRRLCDSVVLVFDADEAGQRAADRAAEVLFAVDLDVKVAVLGLDDSAKDPDELLKQPQGPDAFARILDEAIDLLEFRYRRLAMRLRDAGPAAMQRAVEQELSTLSDLGLGSASPIRRQLVLRTLAGVTGLTPALLASMLPKTRRSGPRSTPQSESAPAPGRVAGPDGVGHDPDSAEPMLLDPRRIAHESGEWGYLIGCALAQDGLARRLIEETTGMFDTMANSPTADAHATEPPTQPPAGPENVSPPSGTDTQSGAYGSAVIARVAQVVSSVASADAARHTDLANPADNATRSTSMLQSVLDRLRDDEQASALAIELERRASAGMHDQDIETSFDDSLREIKRRAYLARADQSASSAAERIKLRQDLHKRFGPNPRSLPRPAPDA